ncbi:unnamed protein product [Taenia asiatica]|uniref:MATH domain-containing protein n=1 Tax=Taenia asiatica TaxID=60517 RepID=A0A0R3W7T8_TAEAS|nr:unnamed protein product [Taenia asiatica]
MNSSLFTSPQLRLIRFSQLAAQNVQFTFLLPASLVRGFISELDSATFEYGNHMWRLRMVRTSLHIGAYLELVVPNRTAESSPSGDFSLWLDFIFTVVNLKHFLDNQTFKEKQVLYNRDNMSHGCGCLIEATVINERNFVNEDGCLLVELELADVAVSLTLPLSLGKENHFESSNFVYGGEVWKVEMTVDRKDRALLNLSFQSSSQTHGYLVSFELLINSGLEVGRRVNLLVHQSGGHIELPENLITQIISSWAESFRRRMIFICLKDIRMYRVSLLTLPKEPPFMQNAEDAGGSPWIVKYSISSDCLYIRLMPQEMEASALQPDSLRVVGWNWCFRDEPLENGGVMQQIYLCQQKSTSQHCYQTGLISSTGVLNKIDSPNDRPQRNMREEEKSECTDSAFPSGSNLKSVSSSESKLGLCF